MRAGSDGQGMDIALPLLLLLLLRVPAVLLPVLVVRYRAGPLLLLSRRDGWERERVGRFWQPPGGLGCCCRWRRPGHTALRERVGEFSPWGDRWAIASTRPVQQQQCGPAAVRWSADLSGGTPRALHPARGGGPNGCRGSCAAAAAVLSASAVLVRRRYSDDGRRRQSVAIPCVRRDGGASPLGAWLLGCRLSGCRASDREERANGALPP